MGGLFRQLTLSRVSSAEGRCLLGFFAVALFMRVLLLAWVGDDAYITFRVIDNFVNGHGLRWNVHERVQAYSNPLWMLLHVPFYYFWRNIFLITIFLSLICTVAAVWLAWRTWHKPPFIAAVFLLLPLGFCRSWTEYSTSGLENPLSHLLFSLFGWMMLRGRGVRQWLWLGGITGIAMLNRLDLSVVFLPMLAGWLVMHRSEVRWRHVAAGLALPAFWLAFSLCYYGFFFPNTKYAKLDGGATAMHYLHYGIRYLQDFVVTDAPGGIVFALGLIAACRCAARYHATRDREDAAVALAGIGAALYTAYVMTIGGDFMAGRMLVLPYFITAWIVYSQAPPRAYAWFAPALSLYLAVLTHYSLILNHQYKPFKWPWVRGICDARPFYAENALIKSLFPLEVRTAPQDQYAQQGKALNQLQPDKPIVEGTIGQIGFFAGPNVKIVDQFAIADPLLARLPAVQPQGRFVIGHLIRKMPPGYLKAVKTGDISHMSPGLGQYYQALKRITQDDLWDRERLKTIVRFQFGTYEHLKKK